MEIVLLQQHPEHMETVVDWFVHQWNESREAAKASLENFTGIPPALLAVDGSRPLGFLGFNIHPLKPRGSDELWINALYVHPGFRRNGVGGRLVRRAVDAAREVGRESLFVYTDIPTFYESLFWNRFSYMAESGMHVLEFAFPKTAILSAITEGT